MPPNCKTLSEPNKLWMNSNWVWIPPIVMWPPPSPQDTTHSPLRRSALRDVTQDNSPTGRKRKLKKQVSFVEHNVSDIYLYTPCTSQSLNDNMVHSPPPYEQIAGLITNRKRTGTGNLNKSDQFFDAASSFSRSIRWWCAKFLHWWYFWVRGRSHIT